MMQALLVSCCTDLKNSIYVFTKYIEGYTWYHNIQDKLTQITIIYNRAQTNLEKTAFFVTLRGSLENPGNFEKIFQISGKRREFC